MNKVINKILDIDKVICRNISIFDESERGLLSQNILSQLRNLVEHIGLFFYADDKDIECTYSNIELANKYVKTKGKLRVLPRFHALLQISVSHYTPNGENSERLMLKYYEYLIRLKALMKDNGIDILQNIDDFPLNTDRTLKEYYEKIADKLNTAQLLVAENEYNGRYYIQKIKPFFVDHQIYYEVTFTIANDHASKFDRIIAFTKLDILPNYAVKLSIRSSKIDILNQKMPVLLIEGWEVNIRQCEMNHFADLFGKHSDITTSTREYRFIMDLLKSENINLSELVQLDDKYYQEIKSNILLNSNTKHIFDLLDKCREIILNSYDGHNIIRYLLYTFNNRIIKYQKTKDECRNLSNLRLSFGTIPFDDMPFNTSLIYHNPKLSDLFQCIDSSGRTHELFARLIRNNTEQGGYLYTSLNDINGFEDIDGLMNEYNKRLYYKHRSSRQLEKQYSHIYINEYENNVYEIIKNLQELSNSHVSGYSDSTEDWLKKQAYEIDCKEKEKYLISMFEESAVALIYGSAGTGKSTLINHISHRFADYHKIYLAKTNPAINNLERKVTAPKTAFMTIDRFLSSYNSNSKCAILFIDECSTVSNSDMVKIIEKAEFELIVLVGDVYQIESITFGNWFDIIRSFTPQTSIFELTIPYRTQNEGLLTLWNHVRMLDNNILEIMTKNDYSNNLDETIFTKNEEDEIILCLNYDGLYGINNINRFLQVANPNNEVVWEGQRYKVGDPILFGDTKRFPSIIYNNLKGRIMKIDKEEEIIYFDVEIDKVINNMDAKFSNLEFMGNTKRGLSVIRFYVNKYKNYDEDDQQSSDAVVPFQVAYAVSIHKAQGLEYDSVKIVITDEVDEMITHNIFYTAITRARKKLKIYWTPETESKVLSNLKLKQSLKDVHILSQKYADLKPE